MYVFTVVVELLYKSKQGLNKLVLQKILSAAMGQVCRTELMAVGSQDTTLELDCILLGYCGNTHLLLRSFSVRHDTIWPGYIHHTMKQNCKLIKSFNIVHIKEEFFFFARVCFLREIDRLQLENSNARKMCHSNSNKTKL